MSGIFLTGATGFVGGHVLRRLAGSGGGPVYCLARDPARLPSVDGDVRAVAGDLTRPESFAEVLRECDTVVHLAALTGKATEAEHFRVNSAATRTLVNAARDAGVRRFLFMSTVAATYPEKKWYPYARAKEEAETIVSASGLDWAVVRPTVVLGANSALWQNFHSLAAAPFLPVFGNGRNAIRPVHVDDVAECVGALLESGELGARAIDVGGRDAMPMGDFLGAIRLAAVGKHGPAVHLPVGLIIRMLALLEPFLFRFLPATAGQFYVFAYDADASSPDVDPPVASRRGIEDLIAEHLAAAPAPVPAPPDAFLDAECGALCRYLARIEPDEYIRRKYREAHRPERNGPARLANDPLTAIACRGPLFARLVDAWSALLARGGTFRRKVVLLLALMESTGSTSARVDSPDPGSAMGFFVGTAFRVAGFALAFAVSLIVVPLLRLTGGGGRP